MALSTFVVPSIEAYLRQAPLLHVYELGDLDPREAPHTQWIANDHAAILIYRGLATPTLIALSHADPAPVRALLASALLPARFYAHLSPGLEAVLATSHRLELVGHNIKLGLTAPIAEPFAATALTPADAGEVVAFYRASYPGAYFEPVNLERGPYLAVRDAIGIAAVAGVHVYSPAMRVAALGNIATRPDARGRGLARRVTGALCRRLQRQVDAIGLNVRADNEAAIACYRRLGFTHVADYDEWLVNRL